MNVFRLSIYAADHVFYEGMCESVTVPTVSGQIGIWANHRSLISAIVPGRLSFRTQDKEEVVAAVAEGLVKVEKNEVLVLVDSAERPEDIDLNRAIQDAEEAKEELLQKRGMVEGRLARGSLARALNRMKIKGGQ